MFRDQVAALLLCSVYLIHLTRGRGEAMTGKRRKLFWTSGRDAAARNVELKGNRSCRRIEVEDLNCYSSDVPCDSLIFLKLCLAI